MRRDFPGRGGGIVWFSIEKESAYEEIYFIGLHGGRKVLFGMERIKVKTTI